MIHIVLSVIALILGALAAMSGASGFWTGCFVGAVMATSGLKWAKHAWSEALKVEAMKQAQLASRETALQRSVQKMEEGKALMPSAFQPTAAPAVVTPLPPPPPVSKSKPPVEASPKPGPAPLPDEAFQPAMSWPSLIGSASFEMPPN